jgi:hypothetical protein
MAAIMGISVVLGVEVLVEVELGSVVGSVELRSVVVVPVAVGSTSVAEGSSNVPVAVGS